MTSGFLMNGMLTLTNSLMRLLRAERPRRPFRPPGVAERRADRPVPDGPRWFADRRRPRAGLRPDSLRCPAEARNTPQHRKAIRPAAPARAAQQPDPDGIGA